MKTHPLKKTQDEDVHFFVREIEHENPYDFSKIHRHTYFEILLFEKGNKGSQIIDFVEYEIKSKCLYIVAPNQVHLLKRQKNENGILIQFTKEFLQNSISPIQFDWLFSLQTNPEIELSKNGFETLYQSFLQLKNICNNQHTYQSFQVKHYFAFLFFQILEILPSPTKVFTEKNTTFQFLELAEKNFSKLRMVSDYVKLLNVSKSKLNNDVKESLGKTPLQIIHDLLMLEIKRLLVIEQRSNKEISYLLHFDSPSTFNRFVLKQTGLKPSVLKSQIAHF
ncbi:MAG: helix-turn-helix domain-containing protein [Saprospiraceae bacterium]